MAFVVPTKRGSFEVRESRSTPAGPRSRTLATFKEMSDEVIEKARSRAAKPPSAEQLRAAAARAGAPLSGPPVDRAARETLRLLASGERLDPMLKRLLIDALTHEPGDQPTDSSRTVSDNARAATQWIGASPVQRGEALVDLLEFSDALPGSRRTAEIGLPEKVIAITKALTAARIPHAIGGAIALAYYAEPRTTIDVDVNIFLSIEKWPRIENALGPLGIGIGVEATELKRHGQARLSWYPNPVDLFFSIDDLHREMPGATRRVPFSGTTIPIVSPEHLAVRKATCDRPKDWLDIEQILVATDPLDLPEIEAWLEAMVGEDDRRMKKLREILVALAIDASGS